MLSKWARKAVPVALVACTLVLATSEALAVVKPQLGNDRHFPVRGKVAGQAWFWENIFDKFPTSSVVLHDPLHPQLIIDVINLPFFESRYNAGKPFSKEQKADLVDRYVSRYLLAMERLAADGKKAINNGAMEKRVYTVYAQDKDALADLYAKKTTIRTQQGLADEFQNAAERARDYMPAMERVFENAKLPIDLTRIVFVESMFNTKAVSKVGASGIWQFMPGTAREFMRVNNYFDERNSPMKATRAAARLLGNNYGVLKHWPLAITAYNHGAGSMQRAVRKLGTNDISRIISDYDAPSFGFASRNFYAEFLAVRAVYQRKFLPLREASDPKIAHFRLPRPMSLAQLMKIPGISQDLLQEYNPCLLPAAYHRFMHRPLPEDYELVLPISIAKRVELALNGKPSRKQSESVAPATNNKIKVRL